MVSLPCISASMIAEMRKGCSRPRVTGVGRLGRRRNHRPCEQSGLGITVQTVTLPLPVAGTLR